MNIYKGSRMDNWRTPSGLWIELDDLYHFKLDLAADKTNAKCDNFFHPGNNSLDINWASWTLSPQWLNPPFSMATEFFQKAADCHNKMVAIYKCSNLETALWQDIILPNADWVCFLRGRVNYENPDGTPSNQVPFGSALIGYNVPSLCNHLGRVWRIR